MQRFVAIALIGTFAAASGARATEATCLTMRVIAPSSCCCQSAPVGQARVDCCKNVEQPVLRDAAIAQSDQHSSVISPSCTDGRPLWVPSVASPVEVSRALPALAAGPPVPLRI